MHRLLALLITVACTVSCSSGSQDRPGQDAPGTYERAAFTAQQLRQLPGLTCPPGVEYALWAELKGSLAQMLTAQLDGGRSVSAPPSGNASASALALDSGSLELTWDYASQGDYDQNSETNIADLTPIAVHFGESTGGAGPFPRGTVQSVIDGDSNGEINIADLTPIGVNFGRIVTGYRVLASLSIGDLPSSNEGPNGPGTEERAVVSFLASDGVPAQDRLSFRFTLPFVQQGWFYWVRPVDGTAEGTPSNVVSFGGLPANLQPLAAITADVTTGNRPLAVNFDASGSTDPDGANGDITDLVSFQWDFDSDGTVDQVTSVPGTSFIYLQQGSFTATVTAFDAGAAFDSASIAVTVNDAQNVAPNAQLTANPTSGAAPLSVNFDFSFSSDTDGTIQTYFMDLDGDGDFDFDSNDANGAPTVTYGLGGAITVTLLVLDNQGATATETLDLDISGGFTPSVVLETGDSEVHDIAIGAFNQANPDDSRIVVAFADDEGRHFMRSTNDLGTAWDASAVLASQFSGGVRNETLHLGVVQGRPVLAFLGGVSNSLHYVRADNAAGSAWPEFPESIDLNSGCRSPHLRIVDGNPGVAYFQGSENFGDEILFARCVDPSGVGFWDITGVQSVDAVNQELDKVQLIFSNDTPAAVYLEGNNMFAERADNDAGSDWDGDGVNGVAGRHVGFSVISEDGDEVVGASVIEVTFEAGQPRELFAVHETNSFGAGFGTFWNAFEQIDPSGEIDNNVEFRRRNSKGAVVYRERDRRELRFALSTSSTGETYEPPQTIAFGQNTDVFDFTVINSHVVVVYYDKLEKRIKAVSGL